MALRYVTLDATGTLLRPAEPIGRTYVRFWGRMTGQKLSTARRGAAEAAATARFPAAFKLLSTQQPNFGSTTASVRASATAYPWWHELILDVIRHANVVEHASQERDERFTRELYAHYARAEAWMVFPDVVPTLEVLRRRNVPLGVISNFDERLDGLLRGLGLRDYFQVVTTSFGQPHMKPHASIFHSTFTALQTAGQVADVDASRVLHVGDHRVRDYEGARAAGADARLLWRSSRAPPSDFPTRHLITSLDEIVA